jgi:ferritin-like metal-binding protein YciE
LASLNDVYTHELQDLHSAETQLLEALPKMAQAATSAELRQAFEHHLEETQGHVQRLDEILAQSGSAPVLRNARAWPA